MIHNTPDTLQPFFLYRERLFNAIKNALDRDGHHKPYEGELELTLVAGSIFEPDKYSWCIGLNCYVLGPARAYTFKGSTLKEALDKANEALDQWIKEEKYA